MALRARLQPRRGRPDRGFAHVALGPQLYGFAAAELDDARRLVEKIVALGGEPSTTVAKLEFHPGPADAFGWLLDTEREAIDAVASVIQATGGDAESEALEHRLEHTIMRKQVQVEALRVPAEARSGARRG